VSKLVVLKFGKGSFEQGFPVTMQLGAESDRPSTEVTGDLPPDLAIPQHYRRWQFTYHRLKLRSRLEAPSEQVTNISFTRDCERAATLLVDRLNLWLRSESFRPIREKWLEQLLLTEIVRMVVQTEDPQLQRLPWHLWDLIERYSNTEVALSLPVYEQVALPHTTHPIIKVLAILGSSQGIDVQADRALLEQLPNAEVCFLVEPQRQTLTDQLWAQPWDILFFAGHSSSQPVNVGDADSKLPYSSESAQTGQISINATESLSIAQLRYALKKAVERGLQLAIFNSCDGLGLARHLADLQLPQMIVMREPVPDRVAQAFLKSFLTAFSQGEPFYLAVREAREKLQGLEDQFPCATWLPVICQNLAAVPPTWQSLSGQAAGSRTAQEQVPAIALQQQPPKQLQRRTSAFVSPRRRNILPPSSFLSPPSSFLRLLLLGLLCTALVGVVRYLGWLQPLELDAFDQMMRSRPAETVDSRLLIVGITEADISAQKQGRGSLSDAALSQLLQKLNQYQPQAIGLDVYRDFPVAPEQAALAQQLRRNPRLIAICKASDPQNNFDGVAAPPEVPPERLGFSDFWEDADGILRRQVLFITPDPTSPCTAPYAFSTQLAFRYLSAKKISPTFTPEGNLQLGNTVFKRLQSHSGGYQGINALGNQILLNYRSAPVVATQVTLAQVLAGQVNRDAVQNRIVLVGVIANSAGDLWSTPYGASATKQMPGVIVQAHLISHLLSAVLDHRPLFWTWSLGGELIWIGGWSAVGGLLGGLRSRKALGRSSLTQFGLAIAAAAGMLYGVCFVSFTQGGWIPFVPALLALILSGGVARVYAAAQDPKFNQALHQELNLMKMKD
jgi:CHASE2 domain-containing sensor protein